MSEFRNLFFRGSPSCITSSVGVELPVLLVSLSIKTIEILYQECGDGGLVVRLRSPVQILPRPSEFSEQKIRPMFAPLHPGV